MLRLEDFINAANKINNANRRGVGNYVVVNSEIADEFNKIQKIEERKKKISKLKKILK